MQMLEALTQLQWLELAGTIASLTYLVLLVREKIACWPFAIVGSLISVYLFVHTKLYSEAGLYFFYALMAAAGWLRWHQREATHTNPVIVEPLRYHAILIMGGILAALGLGYVMHSYTDAQRPLFDAFTTSFSVIATYLEINKVLHGWIYWIILNAASVWLYHDRALDIYAAQIALYTVLSVWGYWRWRNSYRADQALAAQPR